MRAALLASIACLLVLHAPSASAEGLPLSVGISLGYATPLGSAERGSHVSDTTLGAVPIALDVRYRILQRLGVGLRAQYALGLPTLCQTSGDCIASLGGDTAIVVSARYALAGWRSMTPSVETAFGYEWSTARFADANGRSSRSYRGPLLLALRAVVSFHVAKRWSVGPFLEASGATFTDYALDTNASSPSAHIPWRAMHGWVSLGLEVGLEP
jgi:hypothetical protein